MFCMTLKSLDLILPKQELDGKSNICPFCGVKFAT